VTSVAVIGLTGVSGRTASTASWPPSPVALAL